MEFVPSASLCRMATRYNGERRISKYSHHGPVVARKGNKAYTIAIPYADQVGVIDELYQMMSAHNLEEMKRALSSCQLMHRTS